MSVSSAKRSDEFLGVCSQFQLGALITEQSHPATARLSDLARTDVPGALEALFRVDADVLAAFRRFADSGRAGSIRSAIVDALRRGGRVFFTGCGATGRLSIQLDSIWRDFWRQRAALGAQEAAGWQDRTVSVMSGGDFALIKSVEGFEDFAAFGRRQMSDLGVSARDVVFAITEGGETSFVIGTAWQAVDAGARVYFVYNNPDEILRGHVGRSREVIDDPRIEKINLTTGPMAVTGSTRMQATSIQLCVLLTVLEMAARDLAGGSPAAEPAPDEMARGLESLLGWLRAPEFLKSLAGLVGLEESVYRAGLRNNYFADRFAIDVLTDTTERSPTYCTPPFRRFDDPGAADSWSFLFLNEPDSPAAWAHLLKREPRCLDWGDSEIAELVEPSRREQTLAVLRRIRREELMRFRIGRDGLSVRPFRRGDSAVAVLSDVEAERMLGPGGFAAEQIAVAQAAGAGTGILCAGSDLESARDFASAQPGCVFVGVPIPEGSWLLGGLERVGLKLVLNALSTCTMVRLGRVMGNTMIWVVASNLKLIDRATRYVSRLAGLEYAEANRLLFEAIEYVEPRVKADQAHPPVVGLSVVRAQSPVPISFEEAERRLREWSASP
ncbi:MAG: hypothetical protein U1F98_09595 [Verrucomicrobiota bacterium]